MPRARPLMKRNQTLPRPFWNEVLTRMTTIHQRWEQIQRHILQQFKEAKQKASTKEVKGETVEGRHFRQLRAETFTQRQLGAKRGPRLEDAPFYGNSILPEQTYRSLSPKRQ